MPPDRSMISVLIEPEKSGLEPVGPAGQVDAIARRDVLESRVDELFGLLHIAGDQLGALRHAEHRADLADRAGGVLEAPVEQEVGHAGLLLDALRKGNESRVHGAEIQDDVRLGLDHHLHVGGIAAPGKAAKLGQIAHRRQQKRLLVGPRRGGPADHLFGRQHIKNHRGRRAGRHDPLDPVRNLDLAAGRVLDLGRRERPRKERSDQDNKQLPHNSKSLSWRCQETARGLQSPHREHSLRFPSATGPADSGKESAMDLITTTADLAAACLRMSRHAFVTVDTEFLRETTYYPLLCIAQMATADEAVVIDALAPELSLAPFFELMANEGVVKVFHAARQDVEIVWHQAKLIPHPIFDTQVAAMVLGYGDSISYDQLVQRITGNVLDKSHRFTDWSRRPLSAAQISYAISDVTHLREVFLSLSADLQKRGRSEWVGEEMEILTSPDTYRADPDTAWERLKTRVRKPKELSVLMEVAAWREREAQSRDVPRGRVLKDEAIGDIATHAPTTPERLASLRSLPRGFERSKWGTEILEAVKRGLARDPSELPRLDKPRQSLNGNATVELLKVLLRMTFRASRCRRQGDRDRRRPRTHRHRRSRRGAGAPRLAPRHVRQPGDRAQARPTGARGGAGAGRGGGTDVARLERSERQPAADSFAAGRGSTRTSPAPLGGGSHLANPDSLAK